MSDDSMGGRLSDLYVHLRGMASEVEELARWVGDHAIERNALLVRMLREIKDAEQFQECRDRLIEIDLTLKASISRVDIGIYHANETMVSPMMSAVTDLAKQHAEIMSDLDIERSKNKALMARSRDHAQESPMVREAVWSITDGKCFYCEVALVRAPSFDAPGRLFHVDHIVPKANGGPDHISNYVPACERCNGAKSAKSFVEFTRRRQAQLSVIEGGMKDGTNS